MPRLRTLWGGGVSSPGGGGTGSGLPSTVVTKTAAYTAAAGEFIQANTTTGGFTVTLPASPAAGALVTVKKVSSDGNTLTIAPSGGGTIDGDTNATTTTKGGGAVFEHVGSNVWQVAAVTLTTGPAGPTGATGVTGPTGPTGANGANGAIAQVQDEGSNVAVRGTLNFVGSAVAVTDDAANSRTTVTVTGGGSNVPLSGSVVGWYYMPQAGPGALVGSSTTTLNAMQLVPMWLEAGTVDRLAQHVLSGSSGTEAVRLGLYADNGRGYPGSLVVDGGTVDLGTAGIRTVTVNQVISRGLYWTAMVRQGSGSTVGLLGYTATANSASGLLGMSMASFGSNLFDSPRSLVQTGVTGALPATAAPASGSQSFHPAYVRYGA